MNVKTRSTSKGKSGGMERAVNDLVCCFEYLLNILRLEYRIQNYMHSQKFREMFLYNYAEN